MPAFAIGAIDQDLPVEPASPKQCRVQNFRSIGRGQQDNALTGIESVQLSQ
ncbi:hypothetical protein D3C80_1639940 [compost metagenome]